MNAESPLAPHASSPASLKQRIEAERVGRPFLVLRDDLGDQHILTLPDDGEVTIGRRPENWLSLEWDPEVSRIHARLERLGGEWTVTDDGLSRNGSWLNGARVTKRCRLQDGDALRCGATVIAFVSPGERDSDATASAHEPVPGADLTPTQRRVLLALARPFKEPGGLATPATNREIADEVFLSVDAVKGHLRVLFNKFGVQELPQNQKRAQLVWAAFRSGAIAAGDLWE